MRISYAGLAIGIIALIFMSTYTQPKTVSVTYVIDGDTFIIGSGEKVRIIGIDAAELGTDCGKEAHKRLIERIGGREVRLRARHTTADTDVYGRLLRSVKIDGQNVADYMAESPCVQRISARTYGM